MGGLWLMGGADTGREVGWPECERGRDAAAHAPESAGRCAGEHDCAGAAPGFPLRWRAAVGRCAGPRGREDADGTAPPEFRCYMNMRRRRRRS